jgi:hypothetical protein
MTLVLTDVSPWGIVMGADTALTITRGGEEIVRTGAHKLHPIDLLDGGLSFWGLAEIESRPTELWIEDFLRVEDRSLEALATRLCETLGSMRPFGELMGFHLAGYSELDDRPAPEVFHVHNASPDYPGVLESTEFHVERSLSPLHWKGIVESYNGTHQVPQWEMRNGDWAFYAQWIVAMEEMLEVNFRRQGINIPAPDIAAREEYVRFKIKTIADLYRMSDSPSYVAEPIDTLIISPVLQGKFFRRS